MKRIIVLALIIQFITAAGLGQGALNRYEVEWLTNPNAGKKDTREVNAVLTFEKDGIRIRSRRSRTTPSAEAASTPLSGGGEFKKFRYSDIKSAEHSYSKKAPMSNRMALIWTVMTGMPVFLLAREKEKHWLVVATDDDYAVMKIENDNYRLIRMEFIVKKIGIVDVNEAGR